jgi:hypothetical protein
MEKTGRGYLKSTRPVQYMKSRTIAQRRQVQGVQGADAKRGKKKPEKEIPGMQPGISL